ncbi:hypothetical protein [Mesoflavibacter sp. SCSIO 43206]|uniref:hypothetical protein n=1 Tax=Mesoflavibacter sp. SCSIO 43206 TaxID=2779362 RepID=UPI001CAA3B26|nr:hypothetical protein [Mesoflavibacter sp. SCSIO 43206]UAB74974.1 hypothetical protein INR78_11350 [Mesoflavibacter sp. SCSIO 43206]
MSKVLEVINKFKDQILTNKGFFGTIILNDSNISNRERKIVEEVFDILKYHDDLFEHVEFLDVDDILMMLVNTSNETKAASVKYFTLFLDDGFLSFFTFLPNPDIIYGLEYTCWEDIESVELHRFEESTVLTFYFKEEANIENSHFQVMMDDIFFSKTFESSRVIKELIENIVDIPNQIVEEGIIELDTLLEKEKYEEVIKSTLFKDYNNLYEAHQYYIHKIVAYCELEKLNEALEEALEFKKCYDKNQWEYDFDLISLLANLYRECGVSLDSVKWFSYILNNKIDNLHEVENDKIRLLEQEFSKSYNQLMEDFSSIPVQQRKYLFVAEEVLHTDLNGMVVIKQDNLPKNINFPLSHPHLNEIYTCHPINTNSYIPLKDYKDALFLDKLREFKYLMDGLGAKKIEVTNNFRTVDTSEQKTKTNVDVKASYKKIGANVGYEKQDNRDHLLNEEINFLFNQELSPRKMPYIPNGLVWYHTDINWQRIVQQRMSGSLMKHRELITSKKIESLSTLEIKKVNVELGVLFAKVNVDYNKDTLNKAISEKHYSLELVVEFEDIDVLKEKVSSSNQNLIEQNLPEVDANQEALQNYKEEVAFMIEDDGVIDDSERRILERKRKKHGLTKEQAEVIEQELLFSPNEVKYLEEYKLILEEGSITETERKMLARYAKRYDIDETRQYELENSIN